MFAHYTFILKIVKVFSEIPNPIFSSEDMSFFKNQKYTNKEFYYVKSFSFVKTLFTNKNCIVIYRTSSLEDARKKFSYF